MNDRGEEGKGGAAGVAGVIVLPSVRRQWAMQHIAEAGRQGHPPCNSMQQQLQAPALVMLGPCRRAPRPF